MRNITWHQFPVKNLRLIPCLFHLWSEVTRSCKLKHLNRKYIVDYRFISDKLECWSSNLSNQAFQMYVRDCMCSWSIEVYQMNDLILCFRKTKVILMTNWNIYTVVMKFCVCVILLAVCCQLLEARKKRHSIIILNDDNWKECLKGQWMIKL